MAAGGQGISIVLPIQSLDPTLQILVGKGYPFF